MAWVWGWLDPLAGVVFRASISAALLSSLVVLALLGSRQPVRRIALARGAVLGALVLIPLVGLTPLPRFDAAAALRGVGVLPHPLIALLPSGAGSPGLGGRWPARGLLVLYLAGVGASVAALVVGYGGLDWLRRHSKSASPRAQALYDALEFSGRGARPRLRIATRVRGPVLVGILRPTILIPAALDEPTPDANRSAAEALRLSFLHELAHAERADPWFSLLASLAQAVWFFLPTFWWIRARLHLDHEFLADRRAALGFDAPSAYAAALVAMATPLPESHGGGEPSAEPLLGQPGPFGGVGSPLLQRVLMLVQCPFLVEHRPPTWWSWSLPILTLLITPAAACLGLAIWPDAGEPPRPVAPAPQTFQVARLAISPQKPGPHGRAGAFELPLELPEQFDLTLEIRGDRDLLSHCRVIGQQLARSADALDPETWHQVELHRRGGELSLALDGQPVPCQPGLAGITPRLTVEPPPDRPVLVRNLRIIWQEQGAR